MSIIPHVLLPLSKNTHAIIDEIDADLDDFKWYNNGNDYACRKPNLKPRIYLHRVILQRIIGRDLVQGEEADHINRNRLDNRRSNLRVSDRSLNASNRALQTNNTSKYRGVWLNEIGKWRADIKVRGKKICLGTFVTPEEAAHAYDATALKIRGEFAVLNFPKERS